MFWKRTKRAEIKSAREMTAWELTQHLSQTEDEGQKVTNIINYLSYSTQPWDAPDDNPLDTILELHEGQPYWNKVWTLGQGPALSITDHAILKLLLKDAASVIAAYMKFLYKKVYAAKQEYLRLGNCTT